MYLTVYQSGTVYTAMRYSTKDVKTSVLDDTLSTEIFTVEDTDEETLNAKAKEEAEKQGISFVNKLHTK